VAPKFPVLPHFHTIQIFYSFCYRRTRQIRR